MVGDEDRDSAVGLHEAPAAFDRRSADGAASSQLVIQLNRHRRGEAVDPTCSRPTMIRVLYVDDEADDVAVVEELLARAEGASFRLDRAIDAESGLVKLMSGQYDACLVDFRLPGEDGLGFLRQASARGIATPMIMVSSFGTPELDLDAIEAGAVDFIDKEHFEVERLERAIRMALVRQRRRLPGPSEDDARAKLAAGPTRLRERLRDALARARRQRSNGALALLAIDAPAGTDAAQTLAASEDAARQLASAVREADALVPLDGGRLGLVLEQLDRPERGAVVLAKLLALIDAPPFHVSAGIALFPGDADEAEALQAQAEAALARARAEGGGCCQHDRGAEILSCTRLALAAELRHAIENDALSLFFQPQVTLASPELALAAVVHWRHEGGVLESRGLRSLAEASGLLEPLGEWVIAAACRQARRWHDAGLGIHIAVPLLSRRPLGWSGLAGRLGAQLRAASLPPDRLEIEIEEPLLLQACAEDGRALRSLKDLGVRLAVDAFGSGPISLALLRDAPLDTVKLARSLLQGIPEDKVRTALATMLIQLAQRLGLRLVAEGIESQTQLQLLRAEGCDAVQALISCPPLPAEACTDWLHQAAWRS